MKVNWKTEMKRMFSWLFLCDSHCPSSSVSFSSSPQTLHNLFLLYRKAVIAARKPPSYLSLNHFNVTSPLVHLFTTRARQSSSEEHVGKLTEHCVSLSTAKWSYRKCDWGELCIQCKYVFVLECAGGDVSMCVWVELWHIFKYSESNRAQKLSTHVIIVLRLFYYRIKVAFKIFLRIIKMTKIHLITENGMYGIINDGV